MSTYRPPTVDRAHELVKEMLAVNLVEKAFLPKEESVDQTRDVERLRFRYRNNDPKAIRAFSGAMVFRDLSDREVLRVNLASRSALASGGTEIEDRIIVLDPRSAEHDWLVTTPVENMRVSFEPRSIEFSDGSEIGAVDAAPASAPAPAVEAREDPSRSADAAAESAAMARWREAAKADANRADQERAREAKTRHMHEGPDGFMHCDSGYVSSQNECVPQRPDGPNEFWTGK